MRPIRLAAALFVAGALPLSAAAEQLELDPIIVTANRIAQTADESLAAVSVITRDDIERVQPRSMADLLRLQPGLDVVRTGGVGAQTSLFLRGTNSDHALVLIDGIRANGAATGGFSWEDLDPAQVERVEIVRGPRAALYGSDAIGGVVQVFTRNPQGLRIRGEYGRYNTRRGTLAYGGGERVRYHVTGSWLATDGFPSREVSEQDHGSEQFSLSGGVSAPLWGGAELTLGGWASHRNTEFDEDDWPDPGVIERELEANTRTFGALLTDTVSDTWDYEVRVGHNFTSFEDASGKVTNHRYSVDFQNTVGLSERTVLISGLNYYRDAVKSGQWNAYDESNHNQAAFANVLTGWGITDLELSARHDHHSEFGGHTTGSAAVGVQTTPRLRLVASYATAFKAPTFASLYAPIYGNPDLEPENSRSLEVGAIYTLGTHRVSLNAFQTDVEDLIVWGEPYENVDDEARIRGVELSYNGALGPFIYRADLTLQRARDRSDDSRLLRRPDRKLAAQLAYQFRNGAQINVDGLYVGERDDWDRTLSSYTLANLGVMYPLRSGLELNARVENLLDEDYQELSGYNTPERSIYVGIAYHL